MSNSKRGNFVRTGDKQTCPYTDKCYRKNPIHFTEMSHPHLEERDGNGVKNAQSVNTQADPKASIQNVPQFKNSIPQDLRDRIVRNKRMTIAIMKLHEGNDRKAISLSKPSASNGGDEASTFSESSGPSKEEISNETWSKLADRMKKQKLENKDEEKPSKRVSEFSSREADTSKRFKNDQTNKDTNRGHGQSSSRSGRQNADGKGSVRSTNSPRDQDTDLMTAYAGSSSAASRDAIRLKVIEKIRKSVMKMSIVEPGEFALKYALSAPYHIFLTRVEDAKETHEQQFSITFPEILDKSLGEIVSSLQINFMLDAGWLCAQYLLAAQSSDMLILYGEREDQEKLPPNIKTHHIQMPAFGCHHSKLMVLKYKNNGIRVVVSTANLYSDDWENRTQGVWISPHLPQLPESANPSDGESPTGFKRDFERYLQKYNLPDLIEWTYAVRRADFSEVNVFFVASVPGNHKDAEFNSWGHRKLSTVLSQHAFLPPNAPEWPIVAQCSSIGSLGPNYESWLSREIVPAMTREKNQGIKSHPRFQFVYPSINNYKCSFDMRKGACCLPYGLATHQKQQWIESYLYQWKASNTHRDRAIPHIKTYTRISPDLTEIPWFVLTSANLSKAAWGHKRGNHYIMSYEAGIIFVPKFVTGKTTFHIQKEAPDGTPKFPIPYDLPLTRYGSQDKPFVMEFFKGYE
ncbi:LOW QUALITY PROTEIN: probable tyrosyl-DNA phosphodiesterase [Athalia rosae]|uniref:LOW QUALITY PROTEIN: probable tyrosyl-DNA phosphodiesterase n=1 Tax=Athalia rosae TaxID=37344 RepID=UPI0020334AF9|nr:LOW QUALITY PROTEIN: probable tyrosyl-DNA phosphodiesterase [Athalia rosae]